ncbi:efflux RND transporter periplasmic adaptor subunit [Leadbetterella sp. DM7]|uniref:efflux RND transporter periplasmic adaptor subunit n=1 Tax=Leadbetterella sp. DM7 TaxID=3235085 RepID=UPI00349EEB27
MKNYILITAIALFAVSCSKDKQRETDQAGEDKFPVAHPIIKPANNRSEFVAEINAKQNVEIRSKIRGFVEKVLVDEGQFVKNGQLLFSVSNTLHQQELAKTQAQVKIAEAELKAIKLELENSKNLFDKNIISKAELDLASARVEAANAKVAETRSEEERARLNVSFSQIRAPFDGIINRIPNKAGSLVEEGALLTTISNNAEVYTYFNVSEKDYLDFVLNEGEGVASEVTLSLANGMEYPYKGRIETSESEFDRNTGNIAFRARFPNPERLLKHGGSGKVILDNTIPDAIHVPQRSTFEVQDKLYVYVLDAENVLQQRTLQPVMRVPHYYIVDDGIAPGDRILFEGVQNVKAGQKITAQLISREEVEKRINR